MPAAKNDFPLSLNLAERVRIRGFRAGVVCRGILMQMGTVTEHEAVICRARVDEYHLIDR